MTPDVDDQKMPLMEHLYELRTRLIYSVAGLLIAFIGCFAVAETLFYFLAQPLMDTLGEGRRLIFTALPEAFFTQVKVAFFFAAMICFPLFATQFWKFVAPGLYKNEKGAFLPFLIASPILFLIGASFVYYFVFPLAFEFFLSFETTAGSDQLAIENEAKVGEYLSLAMKLIFAFGLAFQLPVALTLLARAGIASSQGMADKRKYAILGVFIVAAIFTPPDPLSQIGLAVPIIILYEISIVLARMVEKKKAERDAEQEAELEAD